MANWSNPQLTSTYTNFLAEVKDRDVDLALQFDGTTSTNIPTNAIRWDSSANRWKKWSGSVWGELTATYALTALTTTGTITGSSTISGTALIPTGSTVPSNGIYLPSTNNVAISTNGTGRLFIDANGNVGVGTGSPSNYANFVTLALADTSGAEIDFIKGSTIQGFIYNAGDIFYAGGSTSVPIALLAGGSERLRITSTGALNFVGAGTAGSTQAVSFSGSAPVNSLVVDASGNLGLGVTPSAWGSNYVVLQTSNGGAFWSSKSGSPTVITSANASFDGSSYKYLANNAATLAIQSGGQHIWYTASSGTAGNPITFTQAMTLDASGNLGLGTTPSGTRKLQVESTGIQLGLTYPSVATWEFRVDSSGNLNFDKDTSSKMTLDASGRLLVGATSTSASTRFVVQGNSVGAGGSGVQHLCFDGVTPASGDGLGYIIFGDSTQAQGAWVTAKRDGGTWSASSKPSRLEFATTPDGVSSPTERMIIKNGGSSAFYCDSTVDTIYSSNAAAAGTSRYLFIGTHSATAPLTGTNAILITTNGNITNLNGSYGTISDAKLKENIVDSTSQWADLRAIKIRSWNFREDTGHETHKQIGPIAQELEQVCPGLVFEAPDRDAEGNDLGTTTKGVNQSVLYMKAVKALQEAMERIETLEAKVAALEAA